MFGLDPGLAVDSTGFETVQHRTQLQIAAGPVLDELASTLTGTGFVVILADARARMVDLRFGERALRDRLERLGVMEGRLFEEETIGTNAIGTVLEIGRGVAVAGDEHFAESLKRFSCYGHPITHPITRKLAGVLDISCLAADASPLLAPFIVRATKQIEERLLTAAGTRQQAVFRAFQLATAGGRSEPIVALGDDVYLANSAALDLLNAADQATLQTMVGEQPQGQSVSALQLSSGRRLDAAVNRFAEGAVFTLHTPADARPTPTRTPPQLRSLLISGEPGTGRTTAVRSRLGAQPARWHDATDTLTIGEKPWLEAFQGSLATKTVVVIENMHLLPPAVARRVSDALDSSRARFVLTSGLTGELRGEHRGLVALCDESVELSPLRSRSTDIPSIVQAMLVEYGAATELRFAPGALAALARYSWPGNFGELARVVRRLIDERKVGDVTTTDLPARYRTPADRRSLTPLEQAECDAIVDALRASKGNKRLAAERLGISRTTLYRSISRYGITVHDGPGKD